MEWLSIQSFPDIEEWMVEHLQKPELAPTFKEAIREFARIIDAERITTQSEEVILHSGSGTIGRHAARTISVNFDDESKSRLIYFAVENGEEIISMDMLMLSEAERITPSKVN